MVDLKKFYLRYSKNRLLKGSLVLFVGSNIANVGSYLYHLLMGRMLGPADYGVLVSLISVLYILGVAAVTLNTVVVRFSSTFRAKGEYGKMYSLFRDFTEKFFLFGLFLFGIYFVFSRQLASFLHVEGFYSSVLITGSLVVFAFLTPINNGLLQSLYKFTFLASNQVFSIFLKLAVSFALVKSGLSVFGALIGNFTGQLIPYLVSYLPLGFLKKYKTKKIAVDWGETANYAAPAFVSVLALTSFYTSDVILVKHFFSAHEAGLYAALGTLGKIVLFASGAIILAMFPIIAQKKEKGENYKKVLKQSLLGVGFVSALITLIYFGFPRLMVTTLYGKEYLEVAPLLGYFAVFIAVYSLVNVLVNFFLSVKETSVALMVLFFALMQIVLIWFFHQSVFQVILMSIIAATLLLFSLLVSYLQYAKR